PLAASPVADGVHDHLPQPGAETAACPIEREGRQDAKEKDKDVLYHIPGVGLGQSAAADIAQEQRLIQVHELLPALGVGLITDAVQQRCAGRNHIAESSNFTAGAARIMPEAKTATLPRRRCGERDCTCPVDARPACLSWNFPVGPTGS